MKRLIPLFSSLLCLSAFAVNITNYPLTNDYSGNELFLLSSIPWQTNFNLPGNYVAKPSITNGLVGSSVTNGLWGSDLTNGLVGSSVTNGLQGALINPLTNGHSVAVTISNALTTTGRVIIQQPDANSGLVVSNGANWVVITNGNIKASTYIMSGNGFTTSSGSDVFNDTGLTIGGSTDFILVSANNGYIKYSGNGGSIEHTNATGRFFYDGTNGTLVISSTLTATNGIVTQRMPCTSNAVTVIAGQQIYCVNGTNQLITLPAANVTWVTNIIYRFTSTNGWGSFIITNGTGAQSIRDGTSLSLTNIGIGEVSLFSDGAAWWLASKAKTILPSASWSSATTITPVQDVITNIPWTDLEYNNSQGITLRTNATFSRPTELWVTNSGTYMITFSAVLKGAAGGSVISLWLRKNGTDVARTRTDQMFSGTSAQQCMTVNYFTSVGAPTYFELCAASHDATPPTIVGGTANPTGYTAPAMPAVIVTINRVSDPWP